MSNVKLAWASAEVEDGTLIVGLEGEVPKDWKRSFERTVALLGDGEWGEVQLKKSAVRVKDVAPGSEEKLRHHLESVVTQANATLERTQSESESESEENSETDEAGEGDGPDAEMTAQFRAFGESEEA
jgi:hypothetical protein